MLIHLIRHGQTDFNAQGRVQGSIDTELNAVGIDQAEQLARSCTIPIDVVISSPMRRARHTADILVAARQLPLETDSSFREQRFGRLEGLTLAEIRVAHPQFFTNDFLHEWRHAPPGGESLGELAVRVDAGLQRVRARHAGKSVALVAHGFVARLIQAMHRGRVDDFFDWRIDNGAIVTLDCSERYPAVVNLEHILSAAQTESG